MKHSKHYFTGTRLMLYALFICMIPTGANAQLFGGMIKPSTNSITLEGPVYCFVGSVYDTDYIPYAASAVPGSTATKTADGIADTPTLNIQGTITTTGITVLMPAVATANGKLKAYTTTVNVPASLTEDGISRDISLTWPEQDYTTNISYIAVTIASVGGTLNVKKLDINAGNGMNNLGVSLGLLYYPTQPNIPNSPLGVLSVNAVPGIPDRMFGKLDNGGLKRHDFLYFPVYDLYSGDIWLNTNLGADYANINDANFKLGGHATSWDDVHSYGSLFQWGRKPDGHELMTWTSSSTGFGQTGFVLTASDNPTHDKFIDYNHEWRVSGSAPLWDATSANNPCPAGFCVPSTAQFDRLLNFYNAAYAYTFDQATGQMSRNFYRYINTHLTPVEDLFVCKTAIEGTDDHTFWTSSRDVTGAPLLMESGGSAGRQYLSSHQAFSMAVRCIKK